MKKIGLAVLSLNTYLLLHLFLLSPTEAWSASLACLPIPAYVQYNVPNSLTVTQRTWHANLNVTSSEWVPACMYCSWDVYLQKQCDSKGAAALASSSHLERWSWSEDLREELCGFTGLLRFVSRCKFSSHYQYMRCA